METANFSISRLYLLMRRQLVINYKSLLISVSACFGVLIIINFLSIYHTGTVDLDVLMSLSFVMMFLGGFIFTSTGFNEIHSPQKSYQYLTLPASTLEKLISIWLLTSILYVIVTVLLIGLLIIICNLFALLFGSTVANYSEFISMPIIKIISVFLITQSIFLLGSCYFRKNNFLKTILALFIIGFVIGLYSVINGYLFFGADFNGFNSNEMNGAMSDFMEDTFPAMVKFLFYYILAPFFYVVTYFVLKERQV